MKTEKINNIWRFICNEHDFVIRKTFPSVKFIDYNSNDDYLDIWDEKGNEYTLHKSDIKHFAEKYYESDDDRRVEEYVLEKMIENIDIKALTDQEVDVQERIIEIIR